MRARITIWFLRKFEAFRDAERMVSLSRLELLKAMMRNRECKLENTRLLFEVERLSPKRDEHGRFIKHE